LVQKVKGDSGEEGFTNGLICNSKKGLSKDGCRKKGANLWKIGEACKGKEWSAEL